MMASVLLCPIRSKPRQDLCGGHHRFNSILLLALSKLPKTKLESVEYVRGI